MSCPFNAVGVVCTEVTVPAEEVCGKCSVVCGEDLQEDKDDFFSNKPDCFYYLEVLECTTNTSLDPLQLTRSVLNVPVGL